MVCPERVYLEKFGELPDCEARSAQRQSGQTAVSVHGMDQSRLPGLQVRHNQSSIITSTQQRSEYLDNGPVCLCSLSYPPPVMAKIKEMGEGIVVKDAPEHRTTIDGVMAKGKRTAVNGKTLLAFFFACKSLSIGNHSN